MEFTILWNYYCLFTKYRCRNTKSCHSNFQRYIKAKDEDLLVPFFPVCGKVVSRNDQREQALLLHHPRQPHRPHLLRRKDHGPEHHPKLLTTYWSCNKDRLTACLLSLICFSIKYTGLQLALSHCSLHCSARHDDFLWKTLPIQATRSYALNAMTRPPGTPSWCGCKFFI